MKTTPSLAIPLSGPIDGEIRIPGSKSLTNRAFLVAALAEGTTLLRGVLKSDDTIYMREALEQVGVRMDRVGPSTAEEYLVHGTGGRLLPTEHPLYIGNAGTAARFLTCALTLGQGQYLLTGNERMQERPIRDLIEAMALAGVKVVDTKGTGCPPLSIPGGGFPGGLVRIPGDKSSQYISALLIAGPYAQKELTLEITGELVSKTYVEMTLQIMADFGVTQVDWDQNQNRIRVAQGQHYQGREYAIEGDASSASYFFAMAAITGGRIKVKGVQKDSTQGDLGLIYILEKMGCQLIWESDGVILQGGPLTAVDVDMNSMSDVAPTLAAVALFAKGTTRIQNVYNMRIKECDRITAMVTELAKTGAVVEEWREGLAITGGGNLKGASFATYDDHRMAMSLALVGLKVPGVEIQDPGCVAKTFPTFFEEFFLPLIRP